MFCDDQGGDPSGLLHGMPNVRLAVPSSFLVYFAGFRRKRQVRDKHDVKILVHSLTENGPSGELQSFGATRVRFVLIKAESWIDTGPVVQTDGGLSNEIGGLCRKRRGHCL